MKAYSDFSFKSFIYAFNGLKYASTSEPNFRVHILLSIVAIVSGICFKITRVEWCVLMLAIGLVIAAECINTAIEKLTDIISPAYNNSAGKVKDLAAAAVLVCSIAALAAGLFIFIPKLG